ncbi:MAG: GTPase, partial [Ignavibacterium sp.]
MKNFKVGYVSIIGLPNVGKSTLLNSILKQKISIVTPKPQTTRKKILGILTENDYQIIFLDTPGIVKPAYLLHEKMLEEINESIKDADVIVLLFDVSS